MWRLALLFLCFIALVILAADTGNLGPFHRIYDIPAGDKVGHFALFGGLALLLNLAAYERFPDLAMPKLTLLVGLILGTAISVEELSQHWMTYRRVDTVDLMAGYAGVLVASSLALRLARPVLGRSARR